jgi:hypothetical protein
MAVTNDNFSFLHYWFWETFIFPLDRCCLWPRGLRCGFVAARLLGLWAQILPGAWMSVSCECCGLSKVAASAMV